MASTTASTPGQPQRGDWPLVKLWHIGFQDARVPSQAEIDRALALTDPRQITLDDVTHSVSLNRPGMEIDLGALAKGFIGDQVIAWLKEQGVESALLNLGGSTVIGLGGNPENEDGMWHVGIQNPADPAQAYGQVVLIKDQALTTSGVAERKLTTNGKTYHHILNPPDRLPGRDDGGVNVLGDADRLFRGTVDDDAVWQNQGADRRCRQNPRADRRGVD